MKFTPRQNSIRTHRSGIFALNECQKAQLVSKFMLQITFLQKLKFQFFHLVLNRTPLALVKECFFEKHWLCFLHCKFEIPVLRKRAFTLGKSRFCNYLFKTTGFRLDFFHKDCNWTLRTCGEPFDWATIYFVPWLRILLAQNLQKVL